MTIDELIKALHRVNSELQVGDILDALWLGTRGRVLSLHEDSPAPSQLVDPEKESPPNPGKKSNTKTSLGNPRSGVVPGQAEQDLPERKKTAPVFSQGKAGPSDDTKKASPVALPAGYALTGGLGLSRALKPFRKRYPSAQLEELDEERTVEITAESNGALQLMFRPVQERWFAVDLVVEDDPAIGIWNDPLKDFAKILRNTGAFREVRSWSLRMSADVTKGPGDSKQYPVLETVAGKCLPARSISWQSSRRLVFFATHGASDYWLDGSYARLLSQWISRSRVVLLHLLDRDDWKRGLLGEPQGLCHAEKPGDVTSALRIERFWWSLVDDDRSIVRIPVAPLTSKGLSEWSTMQMGGGSRCPLFLLDPNPPSIPIEEESQLPREFERRVGHLRQASSYGFQLAVFLSPGVFTIPVARLVQEAMLGRDAHQNQLAEILLSGLVFAHSPPKPNQDPNEVYYEFYPEARAILMHSLRQADANYLAGELEHRVSKYIETIKARTITFRALIADKKGLYDLPDYVQPFAHLGLSLINRKGHPGTSPRKPGRGLAEKYAIVLGCSDYEDERLQKYSNIASSPQRVCDLLQTSSINIKSENIFYLPNPKTVQISQSFQTFKEKNRADLLIFYYCGHIFFNEDEELVLGTTDLASDEILYGLRIPKLGELITKFGAKNNLVFLDANNSGLAAVQLFDEMGGKRQRSDLRPTLAILTSVGPHPFNMDYTENDDIFTESMVRGLSIDMPEADRNQDGRITVLELFQYMVERFQKQGFDQQLPFLRITEGAEEEFTICDSNTIKVTPSTISSESDPDKSLYVCYSGGDIDLRDELLSELRPMLKENGISVLDYYQIDNLKDSESEIGFTIFSAKVAILLVSHNFLASKFIVNIELPLILKAAEEKGLKILWVPIQSIGHDSIPKILGDILAKSLVVPSPKSKPLEILNKNNRRKFFEQVTKAVSRAFETFLNEAISKAETKEDVKKQFFSLNIDEFGALLFSINADAFQPENKIHPVLLKLSLHGWRLFQNQPSLMVNLSLLEPLFSQILEEMDSSNDLFNGADTVLQLSGQANSVPWELFRDKRMAPSVPLAIKNVVVRMAQVRHFGMAQGPDRLELSSGTIGLVLGIHPKSKGKDPFNWHGRTGFISKQLGEKAINNHGGVFTSAKAIISELFRLEWEVIHIICNCANDKKASEVEGISIGQGLFLTPAEIDQMKALPKIVFVDGGAPGFAHGLAKLGVPLVIARGWDALKNDTVEASAFTETFYNHLLGGERFGRALLLARRYVYERFPESTTWAAFQAYGNPDAVVHLFNRPTEPNETEQNVKTRDSYKRTRNKLYPSTTEEFLKSIGSDRTIYLEPKIYLLSDKKMASSKTLKWESEFDGDVITICDIHNLRIVGSSKGVSRLIVSPQYVHVFKFEQCNNISLSHLTMGHEPEKGECIGGVLGFSNCQNCHIIDCDLFGCGTEGFSLNKASNFSCDNSKIRDCTNGIMRLEDCENIRFSECEFSENKEFFGITIDKCEMVLFKDCQIVNNVISDEYSPGPLFNISSSSHVKMVGGIVQGNSAENFVNDEDLLETKNVQLIENSFDLVKSSQDYEKDLSNMGVGFLKKKKTLEKPSAEVLDELFYRNDINLRIEQEGKYFPIIGHEVVLRKKPFTIEFYLIPPPRVKPIEMGISVHASFKEESFFAAKLGKRIPGFNRNTSIAEGKFNKGKDLAISDNAYSYWYFRSEKDHRFDSVGPVRNGFVFSRTVKNLLGVRSRGSLPISKLEKRELYLVLEPNMSSIGWDSRRRKKSPVEYLKIVFETTGVQQEMEKGSKEKLKMNLEEKFEVQRQLKSKGRTKKKPKSNLTHKSPRSGMFLRNTNFEESLYPIEYPWRKLQKNRLGPFIRLVHDFDPIEQHLISAETSQLLRMSLPFYDGIDLVRVRDSRWTQRTLSLFFLYRKDLLVYLDGTAQPIHEANATAPVVLNEENIIDYIRFFGFFVHGEEGPFYIFESIDDEGISQDLEKSEKEILKKFVRPAKFGGVNSEGSFLVNAVLVYSGGIFQADFGISQSGKVTMFNDEPLKVDLPVGIEVSLK